jgi:quercetin dioxygenase-like cupin family protein
MKDTTIKKVSSAYSPTGERGQCYLVSGKNVSMRLWREQPVEKPVEASTRDYETVGFAIRGRAELLIEGQTVTLEAGDSWLVPRGVAHSYRILEPFTAVEATAPPAQVHGRDE